MVIPKRSERKYEPYPDYNDSGVEWLGQIPAHWEIKKIKWDTPVFRGASPRPIDDPIYFDDEGEYAWVRIADVTESGMYLERTTKRLSELGASLSVKMESGELFLSIAGSVGKPCITKIKCCIHDGFVYFPRLTCDTKFLYYVFASGQPYKGLGKLGTQLNLNTDTVASIYMGFPPREEQQAIADLLDRETTRIDELIARKRRLIDLLQEQRTALITHTVTKGLNPDAPMKDSGVEWLGEIPTHWVVYSIKRLEGNAAYVVQTGPFGAQLHASDYTNEGVPLILIKHVYDWQIHEDSMPYIDPEKAEQLAMYTLEPNDIVFSRVGSVGRIALVSEKERGWLISGQMLRLRLRSRKIVPEFLIYFISSKAIAGYLELTSLGSTRDSINTSILRQIPIVVPPPSEQLSIIKYLDQEISRSDSLVAKINQAIQKLQEYRTAIITAAVTGKIDVRTEGAVYD